MAKAFDYRPDRKKRVCYNCHHSALFNPKDVERTMHIELECRLNPPSYVGEVFNHPDHRGNISRWDCDKFKYPVVSEKNPACSHFRPSFESLLVPKEEQTETKSILDEIKEYFGL